MSTYDLLNIREAAVRLQLSEVRVYQFCKSGRLGRKVGHQYLICPKELERFRKIPRPVGNPNFGRKKK